MSKPIIISYRQGHASGSVPCDPADISTTVEAMLKQYRQRPGGTGTSYDQFTITIDQDAFVLQEDEKDQPST